MSDDRVREIRERFEAYVNAGNDYDKGVALAKLQLHADGYIEVLLAELDRVRKVVEAARGAIEYRYAPMVSRIAKYNALEDSVREYDAARSPEPAGGTTVADAGEG